MKKKIFYQIILLFCFSIALFTYQPMENQITRWSKGVGIQAGHSYSEYQLINNNGHKNIILQGLWGEFSHSFFRSIGITLHSRLTVHSVDGDQYFGNIFQLGVPFKLFIEPKEIYTFNLSLVPILRFNTLFKDESLLEIGARIGIFYESFLHYLTWNFTSGYSFLFYESRSSNLLDHSNFSMNITYGYHIYHNSKKNLGIWLRMGLFYRYNHHFILSARENEMLLDHKISLNPHLLFYKNNFALITRFNIPLINLNKDFYQKINLTISTSLSF